MRTAKLLVLGSALVGLGIGASALGEVESTGVESSAAAEVAPAPEAVAQDAAPEVDSADPAEAVAPATAEPDLEAAGAEAPPEPQPQATPEAPVEAAEAPAAEDQAAAAPAALGDPWTAEASDGEAAPEAASEPAPDSESELGAVGYDAQGRPGRIHIVQVGDTLWDISDAYLGTPWVWPSVWQDNREIENPHLIFPGDRIWITPNEMRKVTAEEAAALLAGEPAALEPETAAVEPEAEATPVPEEQPTFFVSDNELVGLVSKEAVEASSSVLANVAPRLMISEADRIWVGLGESEVRPGDQFTIYRTQQKVYDPETGRMLGYHVNLLGWLEIVETHEESSLALVKESASEIVIGDRLMPRHTPPREIALMPSPRQVEGQISFLPNERTQLGTLEYVYLNRGELDGIEVGSPLEVYRRGFLALDETRDAKLQVPDRKVADLLVVRTQPEASVALIRHTEEELTLGDYFRGAR